MTITPPPTRPQPLQDIALDVTASRGIWMAIITALASAGAISLTTSNQLFTLAGLLPGALALLSTVLGAHGVANAGESKVTPISDPMTLVAGVLVPLVPAAAVPPPTDPIVAPPGLPLAPPPAPPATTQRRLI